MRADAGRMARRPWVVATVTALEGLALEVVAGEVLLLLAVREGHEVVCGRAPHQREPVIPQPRDPAGVVDVGEDVESAPGEGRADDSQHRAGGGLERGVVRVALQAA